jgi:Ca2+/Na+ antiporter
LISLKSSLNPHPAKKKISLKNVNGNSYINILIFIAIHAIVSIPKHKQYKKYEKKKSLMEICVKINRSYNKWYTSLLTHVSNREYFPLIHLFRFFCVYMLFLSFRSWKSNDKSHWKRLYATLPAKKKLNECGNLKFIGFWFLLMAF